MEAKEAKTSGGVDEFGVKEFGVGVLAAFIEAFWSSRELAPQIKYGVGAACWALLALYLLFSGRHRRRQGGRHGPE